MNQQLEIKFDGFLFEGISCTKACESDFQVSEVPRYSIHLKVRFFSQFILLVVFDKLL